MGNGKRGKAPCGHDGEAVVGQYYQCSLGCDYKPNASSTDNTETDFEIVFLDRCPSCRSLNTEAYSIDPIHYVWNPGMPIVTAHCCDCGSCW